MKIAVGDGEAHYAKYLLQAKLSTDLAIPFYASREGVYCCNDGELTRAEAWLQEHGIAYRLEELPAPANWERTEGVKYASRSEAIRHIEHGTEPESMILSRLQERLAAAEQKAAKFDALEDRLQSLEKMAKFADNPKKG